MTTEEFNELFESEVVTPLQAAGFRSRGKSLFWKDDERCLSLIRVGGRMQRPNAITHVGCFRHNFLRDLNGEIPNPVSVEVFAYPFKFLPLSCSAIPEYRPMNLSYEAESIDLGSTSDVLEKLVSLRTQMVHNHLPSAKKLTPGMAFDQIRRNGEGAWIETLWVEDYQRFAARQKALQADLPPQ